MDGSSFRITLRTRLHKWAEYVCCTTLKLSHWDKSWTPNPIEGLYPRENLQSQGWASITPRWGGGRCWVLTRHLSGDPIKNQLKPKQTVAPILARRRGSPTMTLVHVDKFCLIHAQQKHVHSDALDNRKPRGTPDIQNSWRETVLDEGQPRVTPYAKLVCLVIAREGCPSLGARHPSNHLSSLSPFVQGTRGHMLQCMLEG